MNQRLKINKLAEFSLGESEESEDSEINETVRLKGKENSEGKLVELFLNQGLIKVKKDADHVCINSTKELLFVSGIDSKVIKYNMINGINVRETEDNVEALDMAIDSEDGLWIHNSLNGKLMKFDKKLVKVKEFEGCPQILAGKFFPYFRHNQHYWALAK